MISLFRKELNARKWSIVGYCLIGACMALLYISMFPSIQRQAANFTNLLDTLPKGYLQAFGINGNGFETLESYLSIELFSFMWPLMVSLYMLSWSGNALAGEVERRTIGTLLAQPVRRSEIYLAKYYAGLTALGAFIACSLLLVMPLASLFSIQYGLRNFIAVSIICFLFGAALLSVGMFVSAFVNERSHVYFLTGGSMLVMYVLHIVAEIKSNLAWLDNLSIFHYFDASTALRLATLDQKSCYVLVTICVLLLFGGLYWYQRRDFAV